MNRTTDNDFFLKTHLSECRHVAEKIHSKSRPEWETKYFSIDSNTTRDDVQIDVERQKEEWRSSDQGKYFNFPRTAISTRSRAHGRRSTTPAILKLRPHRVLYAAHRVFT